MNNEMYHMLQCLADGSALIQDNEWKWFIGSEKVSDAVACVAWCNGWIEAARNWKVWDISDDGRVALLVERSARKVLAK